MDRKYQVFLISLTMSILSYMNNGAFIIPFLQDNGIEYSDFLRSLLWVYWLFTTTLTIYLGYRIGRKSDLRTEYTVYPRYLGYALACSLLVLAPYVSWGEETNAYLQIFYIIRMPGGYTVPATLFSSIALGWFARDGVVYKRELNNVVLKPVLVYNGLVLLRTIFQSVQSYWMMVGGDRTAYSWQMSIVSSFMGLVWLWYVSRMLRSGKETNLEEDYGSILYTIWVPSIVLSVLTYSTHVAFYFYRSGMLFAIPIAYNLKLVAPTLQVYGVPLALLCYGYLNSKYRYNAQLIKDTNEKES